MKNTRTFRDKSGLMASYGVLLIITSFICYLYCYYHCFVYFVLFSWGGEVIFRCNETADRRGDCDEAKYKYILLVRWLTKTIYEASNGDYNNEEILFCSSQENRQPWRGEKKKIEKNI